MGRTNWKKEYRTAMKTMISGDFNSSSVVRVLAEDHPKVFNECIRKVAALAACDNPKSLEELRKSQRRHEIAELAKTQKIEAIKQVREICACGLKEAKEFVDAL